MVQCFRLATCKLSWPEHRAPGELSVSGSGLKCQRRRDKSVSPPSIVLAAPTQLPRYRYGFLALYLMCWLSQSKPSLKPRFSKTEHICRCSCRPSPLRWTWLGSGLGLGLGLGLGVW